MFVLTEISDLIPIYPNQFRLLQDAQSLRDNINEKYADKVLPGAGFCICLKDIIEHSEGRISHGTGVVYVNVKFTLLIFRPSRGEIMQGQIRDNNPEGIRIHVHFFDDIWVPGPSNLFENTKFNTAEQVWVWTTDDGTELFFDNHEIVLLRIEDEQWHDQTPQQPNVLGDIEESEEVPPYILTASMAQAGLGPTVWWGGEEEVGGEEPSEAGMNAT
ncbi:DNA-directed rna polymerase III 25 kd polypeptide [Patellaria atrata CBS 101060]|uniref:DNA-directed RNA polymerase subunit n=1 Tax=Patellaria atrata CBS 101060 TaxID=1346257 RepID=A0A9P4S661_9PEZI|nr:DNA-directed rna polymerase III 25 kd polypeptide [Patellaria atrata CBS 101060]